MLRSFRDKEPRVAESAYVDPQAILIGDVVLEEDASVWPGAVIRGDESRITVQKAANVQDQVVIHSHPDSPAQIGQEVTLGHGAVVHGCTIGKRSLVGINAVVLDEVTVGEHAVVAAGSVVTQGKDVPSGVMVTGAPATPHREIEPDNPIFEAGELYVDIARNHRDHSRVIS